MAVAAYLNTTLLTTSPPCGCSNPDACPVAACGGDFGAVAVGVAADEVVIDRGEHHWVGCGAVGNQGAEHAELTAGLDECARPEGEGDAGVEGGPWPPPTTGIRFPARGRVASAVM